MQTSRAEIRWVLWSGTIGFDKSLEDRATAAAAAGFERFSVSPLDVLAAEESGWAATEIRTWASDRGLAMVMDPVVNWHPHESAWPFRYAQVGLDEVLRMCHDLACPTMTAVAMTNSSVPLPDLAGRFAQLCDRAADVGADVHLEFIPMTVVPDLRSAWAIVRDADRPNGGLLFDTWHFFRGQPDFDLLVTIPGSRVFAVQVNDADDRVRGSLWEDTRRRKLPGDGQFDLGRVIRALATIDALQWVGPEVFSPELAAMPPADAATLAGERLRALLQESLGAGDQDLDVS